MARGMFRNGRSRPTFDTTVELVPVNRTTTDRLRGYGTQPQAEYQAWGSPEVMAEQTLASRTIFDPPRNTNGVQATSLGVYAWYVEGANMHVLFQPNDDEAAFSRSKPVGQNGWSIGQDFVDAIGTPYEVSDENANRPRTETTWPNPQFIYIDPLGNDDPRYNLPAIEFSGDTGRYGILIDDATGQSLYYCNTLVHQCQHYRRAYGVPQLPNLTLLADVKDVSARESVVDGSVVASRTKSLVFAHASLKALLDGEGSIPKEWKLRIGNKELDITQVLDDWVPNRYVRIIAEDRR